MSPSPRTSIIIVNWNVRDLLAGCLRSIAAETDLNDVEVVLVDNASSDGSVEMVRSEFPWVRVIANDTNEGFAKGNNTALPLCRGRYLLLLNPDTVVEDRALDRLVDWAEAHPRAGVVGCRLLNSDKSLQRWTGGAFPNLANLASHHLGLDVLLPPGLRPAPMFRVHDSTVDERVDWISGACLLARREALNGCLFDDAYFMYAEDMELCERVAARGWEVWYTPAVSIVHHHGRSIRQQSGQIALSPVRGPRTFFARTRGRASVLAYDLITTTGFCGRWLVLGAISLISARGRYRDRAHANRQLMWRAVQLFRGR